MPCFMVDIGDRHTFIFQVLLFWVWMGALLLDLLWVIFKGQIFFRPIFSVPYTAMGKRLFIFVCILREGASM